MSWITPTAANVLSSLPESERDLYAGLEDDSEEVLAEILTDAVALVRSRVGACNRNSLNPDATTIPPECKSSLLAIVRYQLIGRINAEELSETDPRTRLYNDAVKFLNSIARCEAAVEQGAPATQASVQLINSQARITGRDKMSGL